MRGLAEQLPGTQAGDRACERSVDGYYKNKCQPTRSKMTQGQVKTD